MQRTYAPERWWQQAQVQKGVVRGSFVWAANGYADRKRCRDDYAQNPIARTTHKMPLPLTKEMFWKVSPDVGKSKQTIFTNFKRL
jgi:hypothetical protein